MSKAQAQKMVQAYLDAELEVLEGKTVTVNGKLMTSEDLEQIIKGRKEWEMRVRAYSKSNGGFGQATFN